MKSDAIDTSVLTPLDIDTMMRGVVLELLSKHPLRRGPYLITDADLKRTLRSLGATR